MEHLKGRAILRGAPGGREGQDIMYVYRYMMVHSPIYAHAQVLVREVCVCVCLSVYLSICAYIHHI